MTDPKKVVKEISLDLWVCNHFRVLPTDDRYKRLTTNQKNLLYLGWLETPTSDQIKAWYDKKSGDPVITESDANDFKKLGYTDKQIKHIKEQLENAGYSQ